jgi:hypothetical protein
MYTFALLKKYQEIICSYLGDGVTCADILCMILPVNEREEGSVMFYWRYPKPF